MDRDLISSAMEFSPHILKTSSKRKKKIPASADSKLSLRYRYQQAEPRTSPLSEHNSSARSTRSTAGSRTASGHLYDKENKHPTLCQCSDCLITSDSSQSPECTLRQIISPRQCIADSHLISEDEDTTEVVESDARTTGTHSTYMTCVSKQTKEDDTSSSEEEDEVEVLQSSIRTLVLSPNNSNMKDEAVSSCEKVKRWLKNHNTKSTSTNIEVTISDSEDDRYSMTKVSSSGYPNTIHSSRRTLEDSFNATSRQSSQDPSSRASSSLFSPSVVEPMQVSNRNAVEPTVPVRESISSQEPVQVPDTQAPNSQVIRESIISTITNSQASTRSSSLYFTDRPPWSKHYVDYRKPNSRPTLQNIREQNESLNKLSNISTHDSTLSSDASFHLVYSETISPQREKSPDNISLSIISNSTRNSYQPTGRFLAPRTRNVNRRALSPTLHDTLPLPDSLYSIMSNTTGDTFHSTKDNQSNRQTKESVVGSASIPDTIPIEDFPDSSFSIVSNTTGNTYHSSRKNQLNLKEKKSIDAVSIPDTIPIDEFSFSNVSTSTRSSRYFNKVSQDQGVPASSIPVSVLLSNITDSLSSPDVREPPQPSSSSQTQTDVFSWPLYSKDELNDILQTIDNQKKSTGKKKTKKPPSSATTIPWPSDCSSPIYPSNSDSVSDDSPAQQHARTTLVNTSTRVQVTSTNNSSDEDQTCVSVTRNVSVIEVSDTDEEEQRENTSVDGKGVEIPETSDSEDENPSKMFRRRPNRASYVEIVISESDSEGEDKEQDKERQVVEETGEEDDDDFYSSSGSEKRNRNKSSNPSQEIPESDSSPEIRHTRKLITRAKNSYRVLESDSSPEVMQTRRRKSRTSAVQVQTQDSEETYFSGEEVEIRESRVPPNFDLPEISEDEEGESAAKKLDFDNDSSEDESPQRKSKKSSIRSNKSSDKSAPSRSNKSSGSSNQDKSNNTVAKQKPSKGNGGKKLKAAKLSRSPFQSPRLPAPARKTHNISSDSSDNDDKLEKFFQSERDKREQKKLHESLDDSPNSIVDDDDDIGNDFCDSKTTPSFYLKILNDDLRRRADKNFVPGLFTPQPKQDLPTPTPTKGRQAPKTVGRAQTKPTYLGGKNAQFSPVLGFVASLSALNHPRCHPEARQFTKNFNRNKKALTARLYELFNEKVFANKLQADMSITWNNRLRTTAGFCYNQRKPTGKIGDFLRTSRIELSSKILHDAGRLRDTLIHEMCHAATWVISGEVGGHGKIWRQWTEKARRCFPELPEISRCHSYEIKTKYTYQCMNCFYSFGRHTNSLDIVRKVCGLCRGKFELIVNEPERPTRNKTPNVFALYVKEHYGVVKNNCKSLKHGDVMKILSQKFAEHKISQK